MSDVFRVDQAVRQPDSALFDRRGRWVVSRCLDEVCLSYETVAASSLRYDQNVSGAVGVLSQSKGVSRDDADRAE